ncbi:1-acyl-sn-glycerol-3-phosphate acyltransferase [Rhodohalobacter sp. SW132]|uniref:lysophospholipid acyltransferase family protein n=1 Tax=Rhodohalobacter sp. SW132 TaxID=2293433 RepID=UPI000E2553CB|nr:lysophospholipid acyltransferase family protein [Rhodohalobacter sp. SW132]REL24756.1 1-acyl-sn-glycerol-3-phosphate acyltransferase [Rhodohalobacter sp. SW132]
MKPTPEQWVRTVLSMIVFFTLLLLVTPLVLFLLLISLGRLTNFIIEKVAPLLAYPVFFILGIQFSIEKHIRPLPSPAVYISNHSSTLDLFCILALGLPRARFIAKWELQYNPLFFILGRLTGQVFIKRQNSEEAVQTLQKAYTRVRKQQLSIFAAPEGSRKHPGIIGEFKKGPFRTAMDLGYPIVPIYFEGNQALSNGGSLFTRKGTIKAHIHPPIDTSGWTLEELEERIAEVRSKYISWAAEDLKLPEETVGDTSKQR